MGFKQVDVYICSFCGRESTHKEFMRLRGEAVNDVNINGIDLRLKLCVDFTENKPKEYCHSNNSFICKDCFDKYKDEIMKSIDELVEEAKKRINEKRKFKYKDKEV